MEKVLQNLVQPSLSWGSFFGGLLMLPVMYFLLLYISAGITHLVLMLFGKASTAGWNGTFATFVYSLGPGFLLVVPTCGWIIVGIWATALQIIGLAKVQRVSVPISTVAVLGFHAAIACCACGVTAAAVSLITAAMGQVGQS